MKNFVRKGNRVSCPVLLTLSRINRALSFMSYHSHVLRRPQKPRRSKFNLTDLSEMTKTNGLTNIQQTKPLQRIKPSQQ